MKSLFIVFAFVSLSMATLAQETSFMNFLSCTGILEEQPVTLDFFEEVDSVWHERTGEGYAIQSTELLNGDIMKVMGKITLTGDEQRIINMYSPLQPSHLFAIFTVNVGERTTVEIFANDPYNEILGAFTCNPGLFYRHRYQ